jgi:hypothetical protein
MAFFGLVPGEKSRNTHVRVEVKGSCITFGGNPAIIAAEVKKGDDVMKLRDDNGVPAWAGWRR